MHGNGRDWGSRSLSQGQGRRSRREVEPRGQGAMLKAAELLFFWSHFWLAWRDPPRRRPVGALRRKIFREDRNGSSIIGDRRLAAGPDPNRSATADSPQKAAGTSNKASFNFRVFCCWPRRVSQSVSLVNTEGRKGKPRLAHAGADGAAATATPDFSKAPSRTGIP